MSTQLPPALRYAVTSLPLGVSESDLAAYLRRHDLDWVIDLRRLLDDTHFTQLAAPPLPAGRPPFHPLSLLGLVVVGLFWRVKSLRRLEELARCDVRAWYVTRGAQPDHSTLGRFLLRHKDTLRNDYFPRVTQHCLRLLTERFGSSFTPGPCSLDGTVIASAASPHRTVNRSTVEARLQKLEADSDSFDAAADREWLRLQAALRVLEDRQQTAQDPDKVAVAPSDLEAYVQPDKDRVTRPSYRPCILVEQHRLVFGQDVHPSNEIATVPQLMGGHQRVVGKKVKVSLGDVLFSQNESLEELLKGSEDVLCAVKPDSPTPQRLPMSRGFFDKSAFTYDPKTQEVVCPQGRTMKKSQKQAKEDKKLLALYRGVGCGQCPVKAKCTKGPLRTVKIYELDPVKDEMRRRRYTPEGRALYALRKQTVELTFADLKERFGQTRFARRGLEGARLEWTLWCLGYNLWRTLQLLRPPRPKKGARREAG